MGLDELQKRANDGMVPWLAYKALAPGTWRPADRHEVPSFDLFPTARPVDMGYLEYAKAFKI
eukprot:1101503-Lingulodinium_polyedra.AAC.1